MLHEELNSTTRGGGIGPLDEEDEQDDIESRRGGGGEQSAAGSFTSATGAITLGAGTGEGLIHQSLQLEDEDEHEVVMAFPWKTASVAVALLVVGLVCLILGLVRVFSNSGSYLIFLIIGSILIIPGAYQTYRIYHAWKGTPGFSFSQLSAFEGGHR